VSRDKHVSETILMIVGKIMHMSRIFDPSHMKILKIKLSDNS